MRRVSLLLICIQTANALFDSDINLNCFGKQYRNVTLTAYYPDYESDNYEEGYRDIKGNQLRTLQDFIDDRNEFVTLSMDDKLHITYGTAVCIPELNRHFGHRIRIQVRDSSSDVAATGFSRAEICVRSEVDSYDINFNRKVTLVFEN